MASDFAAAALFWPLLVAFGGISVLLLIVKPVPPGATGLAGVGIRRIAHGLGFMMLVVLLYCISDAVRLGFTKESLGHIVASEIPRYFAGWVIGHFVIWAALALLFFCVIVIPCLSALSFIRLASTFSVVVGAVLWSGFWAWRTYSTPYNSWCLENVAQCTGKEFLSSIEFWLPAALAFSLGARLPLFKSVHRAAS
jgi:glucan phosphoethanolaminetransferase (alkaline phosphatase superfamily)